MGNANPHEAIALGELVELWTAKLQSARGRYLRAVPDVRRNFLEDHHRASHDSASVAASRRIEAEAFAEYCRVLATYTELAINGTRPGPDPPVVIMISKGRAEGGLR